MTGSANDPGAAPSTPSGAASRQALPEAVIRVRGLKVGFGEKLVMNGLDLDIYRGEVLGFVGASGAGKSVLTRAILGLLPKRAGLIEVYGAERRHAVDRRARSASSSAGASCSNRARCFRA